MARVTIEDCLRRVGNRYILVPIAAKRVRQMRQGSQYLVQSPKNEEIVIALREIAAGKIRISGEEPENREEKRSAKMAKLQKDKVRTRETKPAVKETTVKKAGRKMSTKKAADVGVGIKKEYPKNTNMCQVTFTLPKMAAPDAKSVCIVGDFNNWNIHADRMKKQKNGGYTIKLNLQPGKEYQFRYLIDGSRWENDWNADRYAKSPYGSSDNSVIVL